MRHFLFIIALSILFSYSVFPQSIQELDSLLKILPNDKEDTNKVRHLIFISEDYCLVDYNKSLEYALKALKTAENIKWERGMASSYFRIAHAYYYLGDFKKGLEYKLKELDKWKLLGKKEFICSTLGELGIYYSDLGDNEKAMEYYISSLNIAEEIDYKEKIIMNLSNIAAIYEVQGNNDKAIEYYKQSLKLSEETKNYKTIANNQNNLGNIYSDKGEYIKALNSLKVAKDLYKEINEMNHYAVSLANIGSIYIHLSDSADLQNNPELVKKNRDKALEYFFEALDITQKMGSDFYMLTILGNIGAIYISEKDYDKAEDYLIKAYNLALNSGNPYEILNTNKRLSALYKAINKQALALEYFEKYTQLKDSLFNESSHKTLSELHIKYETEKKEADNIALENHNKIQDLIIEKNRYLLIGLIILILLIVSIALLFYFQNKTKTQKLISKFEQKLLRLQMNPHFLFNSLTNIESFIYEQQPNEAGKYLARFSRLIRNILDNSKNDFITLEKEIETLEYYLSLEKLRLNDNFNYRIDILDNINAEQIFLPPMLAQPFIENAIEHGFCETDEIGDLLITFSIKENSLIIEIKDNGIGIKKSLEQKNIEFSHESMAMEITEERLRLLNKSKKKKMTYIVKDLNDEDKKEQGTLIIFSIPLE